jgi:HSP20 family protein
MVKLTSWSPRNELETLRPLDRDPFFRRFFSLMDPDLEDMGRWTPVMNIYETKTDLVITLDIPGLDPKALEINLQGQTLSIQGERPTPTLGDDVRELRAEQSFGRFQRTLHLPIQVDPDKVSAEARNGVMTITMPKASQYLGRQIPIECK